MGWFDSILSVGQLALGAYSAYSGQRATADQIDSDNAAKAEQYAYNEKITSEMLVTLAERTSIAKTEATRTMVRAKLTAYRAGEAAEREYGVTKKAADRAAYKSIYKSIVKKKELALVTSEATRMKLNQVLEAAKGAHVAEGEATVSAAQRGGGAGTRASLATYRPAARQRGDISTGAEVDLQTRLTKVDDALDSTNIELQVELGTILDTMAEAGIDLDLAKRDVSEAIVDADINLETELRNISNQYDDTARQAEINLHNNYPIMGSAPSTGEMLLSAAQGTLNTYSRMSEVGKAQIGNTLSSIADLFSGKRATLSGLSGSSSSGGFLSNL